MLSELASILWPIVVLVVGWRLASTFDYIAKRPERQREEADAKSFDIPEDLVALALNEREDWAREEALRAIREKYEQLGDWNMVRRAVGVANRGA